MRFFALTVAGLTLGLSSAAWSAEAGTYRQGQAYRSMPASHPNQCQSACQSDTICRGWNFVKVNIRAQNGVCELNARDALAQPSPVSISGARLSNETARVIPAGVRTRRVGEVPHYQPGKTLKVGAVPQTSPRAQTPKIQTPNTQIRTIKPAPQPRIIPAVATPVAAPTSPPTVTRRRPARSKHSESVLPKAAAPAAPKSVHRVQPAPAPIRAAAPRMAAKPAQPRMPIDPALAGAPAQKVQQKLFGSLYDDVKAPKALTPSDIPADADAPIATMETKAVSELR